MPTEIESQSPGINVGGLKHARSIVRILGELRRPNHQLRAAEVGVYRGATATYVLEHCPDVLLSLIDPWSVPALDSSYLASGDKCAHQSQEQQDENYRITLAAMAPFAGRFHVVRKPSLEAAGEYPAGSLDLVFIDAAHDYESVKADVAAWWPKVRSGGVLSGHDYSHRRHVGVVTAVHEFADGLGLPVIPERGKMWVIRKP